MKALAASLATAAVLAGGSSSAAPSPPLTAQIAAVNASIAKLNHWLPAFNRSVRVVNTRLNQISSRVDAASHTTASLQATLVCLTKQWDATTYTPILGYTANGFGTLSGNVTMLVEPSQADGLVGTDYLLESSTIGAAC